MQDQVQVLAQKREVLHSHVCFQVPVKADIHMTN